MARQLAVTHMMANVAASCAAQIGRIKITNPNADATKRVFPSRDAEVTNIRGRIAAEVNPNFYSEESIRMRLNMTCWTDTDIGRCDESAATAVGFCLKALRETQVEACVELLGTGHHAFVVAARDVSVDINRLVAWGDDAFVVDIWLARQYGCAAVIPDPRLWDYLIQNAGARTLTVCRGWMLSKKPQQSGLYTWSQNGIRSPSIL